MPAPTSSRIRVAFSGSIGGGGSWSASHWGTANFNNISTAAELQDAAADIGVLALALWHDALAEMNTADTTFTTVTIDAFLPDSQAIFLQSINGGFAQTGTETAPASASQAIVASLHTPLPGRSGRGRMYWPATGALGAVPALHSFTTAQALNLAEAMATYFNGFNSDGTTPFAGRRAVVQSLKLAATNAITSVSVDTRPDRQENRERNLPFVTQAALLA